MSLRLSICIPTYNRPAALRRTLERLLPQLTVECEVFILDNASTDQAVDILAPVLAQNPQSNVKIIRNPANVGGNTNILRCFEVATGDYTWVLGDDDKLAEDAVEIILAAISEFPDVAFFTFASSLLTPEAIAKRAPFRCAATLEEFIDKIDNFGNLLFISCGVHRTETYRRNISLAYDFMNSCSGQLVPVFLSYRATTSKSIFHPAVLIEHDVSLETAPLQWNIVNRFLPQLLYVIPDEVQRTALADKIHEVHPIPIFGFKRSMRWLVEVPDDKLHTIVVDAAERLLFLALWRPRRMYSSVFLLLVLIVCLPFRKLLAIPALIYKLTKNIKEKKSYQTADAMGRFIDKYSR